jgi:hypothetical protein
MKSLRRVVYQVIEAITSSASSAADHIHMARAYRPVSGKMIPRWRNLGTAITPYHFMRPALVPVKQAPNQKNFR